MLRNLWHHFLLITRHRHKVIAHCKKAGILWQGLRHDLSKYSPTEFIPGVKYYQGNRSPNEKEREILGYSLAWLHHKGRNRHHFEYWTDYSLTGEGIVGVEMPKRYVAEMFCDRIAACRVYQGEKYTDASPYDYYQGSKGHILINQETSDLLDRWLLLLKKQGEDAAFPQIRRELKDPAY